MCSGEAQIWHHGEQTLKDPLPRATAVTGVAATVWGANFLFVLNLLIILSLLLFQQHIIFKKANVVDSYTVISNCIQLFN